MRQLIALVVIASPSLSVAAPMRAVPRVAAAVPSARSAFATPLSIAAERAAAAEAAALQGGAFTIPPASAALWLGTGDPVVLEDRSIADNPNQQLLRRVALYDPTRAQDSERRLAEYFDGQKAEGRISSFELSSAAGQLEFSAGGREADVHAVLERAGELAHVRKGLPVGKVRGMVARGFDPNVKLWSDRAIPLTGAHSREIVIEGRGNTVIELAQKINDRLAPLSLEDGQTSARWYIGLLKDITIVRLSGPVAKVDSWAAEAFRLAGLPSRIPK